MSDAPRPDQLTPDALQTAAQVLVKMLDGDHSPAKMRSVLAELTARPVGPLGWARVAELSRAKDFGGGMVQLNQAPASGADLSIPLYHEPGLLTLANTAGVARLIEASRALAAVLPTSSSYAFAGEAAALRQALVDVAAEAEVNAHA